MKYVLTWKKKRHGTTNEFEAAQKRVLEMMRAWRRPERRQLLYASSSNVLAIDS